MKVYEAVAETLTSAFLRGCHAALICRRERFEQPNKVRYRIRGLCRD